MPNPANKASTDKIVSLTVDQDWTLSLQLKPIPIIVIVIVCIAIFFAWKIFTKSRLKDLEIDTAEFGFGSQKISLKPNRADRQIAYSIWVELSTRKIGLPIDPENDVIEDVYNSWYAFFGVTRELIKDIPVSKVRDDSTGKIIGLSIDVLNEGLRPHLTKWQARFRHWIEQQKDNKSELSPQQIQKQYPEYSLLLEDLLKVNKSLVAYREKMDELVKTS